MLRAHRLRSVSVLAILVSLFVPLAAGCGGGGKSGTANDRDLMVTYFSHGNRTDVYRNQPIEIRFSAPVKPSSVSGRTIRFLTGPSLQTPQDGALEVEGNRIFFLPTRSAESFKRDGKTVVPDRPFGFEPLANYQLFIPGPPSLKTLQNRSGAPIVKSYFASFTTSDEYMPELDPPTFIGIDGTGQLGFSPDMKFDETQGKFVVPYDSQIILQFDEVIARSSMDPGVTVLIKNEDVLDFLGRPIDIPGTFKPSQDGTTWFFVPSFHYGTGPYRISITLTQGITDLAGNPLANPRTMFFETEYNPNVKTIGTITESFDTNTFEDAPATDADWNSAVPGVLQGGAITTNIVVVNYTPDNINSRNVGVDYPLTASSAKPACFAWPNGNHTQASFKQEDIGEEGAITEIAWGPDSNATFAATHSNIQIRLGHTKTPEGILGSTFAENFRDGVPLPHYDGSYDIPQRANINPPGLDDGFLPFPKLTTPFDYDGQDGLVVDWQVTSSADCQTLRAWFWGVAATSPGVKNIVATSKTGTTDNYTGGGQPLVYDLQVTKRRRLTNARSKWYDTAQTQPEYGTPILSPPEQSGGASYLLEWQGADGMPNPMNPSQIIPDPSTETAWATGIDVADGKRFIRFRVLMIANLNSDTLTRFTQIQIPYQFTP